MGVPISAFFLIFPWVHQTPQLRDWSWLRPWAVALARTRGSSKEESVHPFPQFFHFGEGGNVCTGIRAWNSSPGSVSVPWHSTSPLASNIWANALRTFAKLIVRLVGNTNKHMHKSSHGQMGHKTLLFLQFSSIIWASLTCHLLLALLLQVTRPSPWF